MSRLLSRYPASYLTGTFGSSLAIIYAYNASNTSGHTKKVSHPLKCCPFILMGPFDRVKGDDKRDDDGDL